MIYEIYKGEKRINRIVAEEAFCAEYCEANGYTYAPVPEAEPEEAAEEAFDAEAYLLDLDYRLSLLELGVSENDVPTV